MLNKLIELGAKEGIEIEVSKVKSARTEISYFNCNLKEFKISDIKSYTIKALKDDRKALLHTETLKNPEEIIKSLKSILSICDNPNPSKLNKTSIQIKEVNEEIDIKTIKKDLLSLNELKEKYPSIKDISTTYCHYKDDFEINNKDAELKDNYYFNEYSSTVTISNGSNNIVAYVIFYSTNYDFLAFKNKVESKIEESIIKLDSSSCKTTKYNIILKNNAAANLLSYFVDMFFAKNIALKKSVLTEKINTKVFSDKITIIEDSAGPTSLIKIHFDSEGSKKIVNTIIDKGVFVKELNDIEYALKNNKPLTGNSNGVNNLYISPTKTNYPDLVKELNNGIIIDELYGLHSGLDHTTGNISLQSEGYLVENGKITQGLNMIIISTNIFELFNNIKDIGSDMSSNRCDAKSPSLLIENITIAGKK